MMPRGNPQSGVRYACGGALLCAFALKAGAAVQAGGALSEDEYLGDMPVVLSASRLSQPVSEAPNPVTVIDREMIRASGFREVPDLFRLVPGFYVGHFDGTMQTVNHGLPDQYSRRMQVLVDGRSIYTPVFGGVEWADLPLAMDDIERIEVIRGPNAATYGANAFLGIINIITRHAAEDRGAHAALISGDKGVGQGTLRLGSSHGSLDYRLTYGYREDRGFDNRYDSKRMQMLTLRGDYRVDNLDALQVQAGYTLGERGTGFATTPTNQPRDVGVDSHFEQIRWQRSSDAGNETSVQFYHTYHKSSEAQTTAQFVSYLGPLALTVFPTVIAADVLAERYDLEFQQIAAPLAAVRVVWGAGFRLDQVTSPLYFNTQTALNNRLRRLFGNLEWRATPQLLVNAGAMLETNDLTGTDTSPRLALNYHLSPQHTLRASISRALRTPVLFEDRSNYRITLNTSIGPYTAQLFRSLYDLLPEKITSREAGYIGRFGERWEVDARVYQDRITQLISNHAESGVAGFRGGDWATLGGTELQVKYVAAPDSQLIFAHNYSHVASSDIDNRYSRTTPAHNYSLLGMHRFAGDYYASFGYYRVGGLSALGESTPVEGYQRLDLRGARRFKIAAGRGEVALVAQNVLDDYKEFRNDNVFDRRVFLSVNLDF